MKGRETALIAWPTTLEGAKALIFLDETFIGTENYMGICYFWAHEYRHYLRDATPLQRVRCHNAFLAAGLAVDGESDAHEQIIKSIPMRSYK